jgi:protein transport protein SEC31
MFAAANNNNNITMMLPLRGGGGGARGKQKRRVGVVLRGRTFAAAAFAAAEEKRRPSRYSSSSSSSESDNENYADDVNERGGGGKKKNRRPRGWDTADKAYAKFGTKKREENYDDDESASYNNNNRGRQQQQQQQERAVPLDELERKQIALERQKLRGGRKYADDFEEYENTEEDDVDDLAGWSRFANESGIKEGVSSSSSSSRVKKVISSSSPPKVAVQSKYKRGGLRPWETQRMEREKKKEAEQQRREPQRRDSYYNHNDDDDDDSNEKQLSDNAFVNAGLEAITAENLNKAGLKRPTEIQKLATPELIEGNSAVILAETGSGKTFAYTLPLMSQVAAPGRGGTKVSGRCCPAMVILVPNVELARQVSKMAELCSIWCQRTDLELPAPTVFSIFGKEKKLLKPTSLKQRKNTNNRNRKYVASKSSTTTKAGKKGNKIIGDLEEAIPEFRRADVLICTPARLLALAKDEWVLFGRLKHFVVDECDEMLSRGFADDVKHLIDLTYGENADGVNKFGAKVQYVFAAATLKDSEPIFESFQGDLSWISTGYFGKLHPQLEQEVVMIEREEEEEEEEEEKETESHENEDENDNDDDMEKAQQRKRRENSIRTRKNKALVEALRKRKEYKSLVFANSPVEADEIVEYLNTNTDINGEENNSSGMYSMAFHGKAKERGVVLDDFISGELKVCVCTDLAARGIDFPELHHVVHYSLADSAAMHIHRTGRTARAGQPGPYYCTVLYDKEEIVVEDIGDDLKELLELTKSKSSPRKQYQRGGNNTI